MAKTKPVNFKLADALFYTPKFLQENFTEAELRKEYTRLRDIAQKRLKRLAASEFHDSEFYRQWSNRFPKLADARSKRAVAIGLSDLEIFLNKREGSVSGMREARKKHISALHEHGYDFVNEENFDDFTDFMEYARASNYGGMLDSDEVVEMYNEGLQKGDSLEDIRDTFDNYQKAKAKHTKRSRAGERKARSKVMKKELEKTRKIRKRINRANR